jgi:hypothetical protein
MPYVHPMRTWVVLLTVSMLSGGLGCDDDQGEGPRSVVTAKPRSIVPQVSPPIDIKTPPGDATTTASGLVYKKVVENPAGSRATPADTALIRYTGWRQRTGETFFTTNGRQHPIGLDLAHSSPGFREALQLLHKGETMMLWVPPGQGSTETLVYQIEVADIVVPQVLAKQSPKK